MPARKEPKTKPLKTERYTAKDLVFNLPVFVTGCPLPNIPLIGVKKDTVFNAVITVDKPIYPVEQYVEIIREDKELWAAFLEKVKALPGFEKVDNLEDWFANKTKGKKKNTVARNFRLGDTVPNSMIQLLSPGTAEDGYFLNKENPEGTLAAWLKKPYTPTEFENFVPRKPGQGKDDKKRHTLLLNATNWRIHKDANVIKRNLHEELQSGKIKMLLNGYTGKLHSSQASIAEAVRTAQENRATEFTEGTVPVLVRLSCFPKVVGLYALLPTAKDSRASLPSAVIEDVVARCNIRTPINALSHLTPAGLKSVLQKIVRVRPSVVSFVLPGDSGDTYQVAAEDMLLLACLLLATHTGSFVPDISSFVSGSQSFFKRLVVICYEDAYPSDTKNAASELAAAAIRALVCKETRDWVCPSSDLVRFLMLAKSGLDSRKALIFNHKQTKPSFDLALTSENESHKLVSIAMDSLRSFETDLNMIRDVASKKELDFEEISIKDLKQATKVFSSCKGHHILSVDAPVMPIYHALDAHFATQIAYYFDNTNIPVGEENSVSSTPFKSFFGKIWDFSSSINPRRSRSFMRYHGLEEAHAFYHELKYAQSMLWLAMVNGNHFHRPLLGSSSRTSKAAFREIRYSLHKDWLHAMIGHITVKNGNVSYYCTVLSESPLELSVSRKPSRGLKEEEMKESLKADVIKEAIKALEKGVPLSATKYHPPGTKGMYAQLFEKSFFRIVPSPSSPSRQAAVRAKTWEEMRHVTFRAPFVKPQPKEMYIAIVSSNKEGGVEEDFESSIEALCLSSPLETLRRFLQLADGYNDVIVMPGIGREGGGTTEGLPKTQDIDVFQFILRLSISCPGALRLDNRTQRKFLLTHRILFWYIRDEIVRKVYVKKISDVALGSRDISSSSAQLSRQWKPRADVREQDRMKRDLRHDQLEGVEFLKQRHDAGFRANMLFVSTGSGKTLTILTYLLRLNEVESLPRYVVISVPSSALENTVYEVLALFPKVRILDPTKQKATKKIKNAEVVKVEDVLRGKGGGQLLRERTIHIVRHDHIRMKPIGTYSLADALMPYAHDMFFIVDEFHQLLAVDALKTAAALQVASASKELAILSATPCKDSRIKTIMPWLAMLVEFEVTEHNFFFAMNAAFSKIVRTGIPREYITEIVEIDKGHTDYYSLAPPGLGGSNRNFGSDNSIQRIFDIAYDYVTKGFVRLTSSILKNEPESRIFIVCRNKEHQQAVASAILEENAVPGGKSYVHVMSKPIMLTPSLVASGQQPDYKVVVGTIAMNAGFSLTTCNVMLTAPYPSNESTRTQLLGRIDRFGSKAKLLRYYTVVAGLLLNMKLRQDEAASWRQAVEDLAGTALAQ